MCVCVCVCVCVYVCVCVCVYVLARTLNTKLPGFIVVVFRVMCHCACAHEFPCHNTATKKHRLTKKQNWRRNGSRWMCNRRIMWMSDRWIGPLSLSALHQLPPPIKFATTRPNRVSLAPLSKTSKSVWCRGEELGVARFESSPHTLLCEHANCVIFIILP